MYVVQTGERMIEDQPKLSLDPNRGFATDHVVYTELDALLDTRLGVLHGLDPQFAIDTVSNPNYFKRVSDDFSVFCGVRFDDYKLAYKKRDVGTLQDSIVTNAAFVLNSVCSELNRQRSETPFSKSVSVEVNIWPYDLTELEQREFENAVMSMVPMEVVVRIVNIPIEELKLRYVAKHYTGMLIYNFAEWLQLHCREFEEVTIPGITILAPKLHVEGNTAFTSKDLGSDIPDLDPYEMISMMHAPLMGLEWLEPHHFCMVTDQSVDAHSKVDTAQSPQESA